MTADAPALAPPSDFVELPELRPASLAHALGYFRDGRFVLFGYCPAGGEVMWKDGRSAGFGTGGWKHFLQDIAPVARRHGADLGTLDSPGTHVLILDRAGPAAYAAPRTSAEAFLARATGTPAPTRPCLCTLANCAACPLRARCFPSQPHPSPA